MDSGITFVGGGVGKTLDVRNTLDVGDRVGNDTAWTDNTLSVLSFQQQFYTNLKELELGRPRWLKGDTT